MNEFEIFEENVNGSRAEDSAKRIKAYCESRKNCMGCWFYIGTCKLVQHPCNWEFKNDNKGN